MTTDRVRPAAIVCLKPLACITLLKKCLTITRTHARPHTHIHVVYSAMHRRQEFVTLRYARLGCVTVKAAELFTVSRPVRLVSFVSRRRYTHISLLCSLTCHRILVPYFRSTAHLCDKPKTNFRINDCQRFISEQASKLCLKH